MGKWSKEPKKGCCEYVFRHDGFADYCVEPISNEYSDKDNNIFCIFHSRNEQKTDEFYRMIRSEIEKNTKTVEKKIKMLGRKYLPENIFKEKENQARRENPLNFSGYYFPGQAYFFGVTFSGKAHFSRATFSGGAYFRGGTVFSGGAVFTEAAFSGDAYFEATAFSGDAYFEETAFSGEASFSSATFSGEAVFTEAAFSGEAYFFGAAFSGEVDFSKIISNKNLMYDNAKFTKRAEFTGVDLTSASFDGAELHNSFIQGIKYSNRTMKGILLDTFTENTNRIFARDAADFNYLEQKKQNLRYMRKRKIRLKGIKWVRDLYVKYVKYPCKQLLFWMWGLMSDHGQSFILWLTWCFLLVFIFGMIFIGPLHGQLSIKPESDIYDWYAPFYYSIVTFTTLGFGDIVPITHTARVVVTLEVIMGYIMLGGLISILANKFARRA